MPADVAHVPGARLTRRPGCQEFQCPCPRALNGHLSPGRLTCSHVRRQRGLLKEEYLPDGPSPLPAPMGSYLSSPQPSLPPLAQRHPNRRPGPSLARDGFHGGHRVHTGPLPQIPVWEPATTRRVVSEDQQHLPAKLPPEAILGPHLSCSWESYMKRGLGRARHARPSRSPVTVKIAPPERRESSRASPGQGDRSAGHPFTECPDPRAKQTVLRGLSQCRKGSRKFDTPLWFEIPEYTSGFQDPESRPSAFKPLIKNGEVPSFVPRPGPLNRRLPSWSYICKEETDPGPDSQPFLSAANHTGTVPAQGTEPQLGSWEKRPQGRGLSQSSRAQGASARSPLPLRMPCLLEPLAAKNQGPATHVRDSNLLTHSRVADSYLQPTWDSDTVPLQSRDVPSLQAPPALDLWIPH